MNAKRTLEACIRGWFPQNPFPTLPENRKIRLAGVNRRAVDKRLLAGTVTVSLIVLIFGAFMYSTFGAPIVRESKTQVRYPIKEPQVEESLQSYIGVYMTKGIFEGNVSWIGIPEDPVKELRNIHLVSYACEVSRNYHEGHLWSVTVEEHVAVSKDKFTLPNGTIGYQEAVIPLLSADLPEYTFQFNFSIAVSGVETWHE